MAKITFKTKEQIEAEKKPSVKFKKELLTQQDKDKLLLLLAERAGLLE